MYKEHVTFDHEFYEVLNAFPVLEQSVERLHVKKGWIKEGKTILEILLAKNFSKDEIMILVRRLNMDIAAFLKGTLEKHELLEEEPVRKPSLGIQFL